MTTVTTPTLIVPSKEYVSLYNPTKDYFMDTYVANVAHLGTNRPVHSYRHLGESTDAELALHYYTAHVVYNYTCNVGDTFQLLIDNDEITLFIKEDGVYYTYLSNEDAEDMSDAYWAYDSVSAQVGRVEF